MTTDQPIQTPVEPPLPAPDVLPKPMEVGLSLIKPAGTLAKATEALPGRPKLAVGVELVAEKIKTMRALTDEALAPMQAQVERPQDGVEGLDGAAQLPAGPGQQHDVVNVPYVAEQLSAALALVKKRKSGRSA